jgi:hypothetical protein
LTENKAVDRIKGNHRVAFFIFGEIDSMKGKDRLDKLVTTLNIFIKFSVPKRMSGGRGIAKVESGIIA